MPNGPEPDVARGLNFLERDAFHHIMLLKYWQAYAASSRLTVREDGGRIGVRIVVPTASSPYDRRTYPQTSAVVFVRAETPTVAQALVSELPRDRALIFKLVEAVDVPAVRTVLPVQRRTAFVSFTTAEPVPAWQVQSGVNITRRPKADALPLHAEQGYEQEEIDDYVRSLDGRFFAWRDAHDGLLGACLSYCNYRHIHEIGGLFTRPAARRRGIARHLVETALAELAGAGLVPRYQVHESNAPSIALAQTLGLVPAVTAEHWLFTP